MSTTSLPKAKLTTTQLCNTIQVAKECGVTFSEDVTQSIEQLTNPVYKIGIVGRFQVGKTTLVNHVFLRQPILKEGEGLCTTAVCTEVTYGERLLARMIKNGKETIDEHPSAEDIIRWTTAGDEDARLKLAEEITQLRIETPNPNLKNYLILDTPGIDDPNTELLNITTYRELPKCDLVILVAEPRQLSQIDIDFLNGSIFKSGLTKVMLLLSYDKDGRGRMTPAGRRNVLDEVRSKLDNMGLGDIPLHMVCYDNSAADILDSAERVEQEVLAFLQDSVAAGRLQRVASQVAYEISSQAESLRVQATLATKSREDVEALRIEMEHSLQTVTERMNGVKENIGQSVAELHDSMRYSLNERIESAKTMAGDTYDERWIRSAIDAIAAALNAEINQSFNCLVQNQWKTIEDIASSMDDFLGDGFKTNNAEIEIQEQAEGEHPFEENIAIPLIDAVQGPLAAWLLKFPNIWAKIAGAAVGALPALFRFLNRSIIRDQIAEALEAAMPQISEQMDLQIEQMHTSVLSTLDDILKKQSAKLQDAFELALDDKEDDAKALAQSAAQLSELVQSLK